MLHFAIEPAFPKSLYNIKECLDAVALNNPNAVILDFFAGSGTTAHALLEMNNLDSGQRRFILCTNNEGNICEEICYPRIKKVIEGYNCESKTKSLVFEKKLTLTNLKRVTEYFEEVERLKVEHESLYENFETKFEDNTLKLFGIVSGGRRVSGLGGNLKYYKTTFVPSKPTDRNKEKLTKKSVEMLCLRENTFDLVADSDTYKIFKDIEKYTGILFDQLDIPAFKEKLAKYDKPINVYVFSLSNDDFAEEFEDMGVKVKVCAIPEAILRVYRRIFK